LLAKDFGNLPKDKVLLVEHEMRLHFNFLFFSHTCHWRNEGLSICPSKHSHTTH